MHRALSVVLLLLGLGLAGAARALVIDDGAWGDCLGASSCALDGGATLTASGGNFLAKSLSGRSGLGISGSPTPGEIDVGQTIRIEFADAVIVERFELLFLYNGAEFGDPLEMASMSVNDGAFIAYAQTTAEENTIHLGDFDDAATWANCGATDNSPTGTGCFTVTNPFGAMAISNLTFGAASAGSESGGSDYSLGSLHAASEIVTISSTGVPEPASLFLTGVGLLLLASFRRRARR